MQEEEEPEEVEEEPEVNQETFAILELTPGKIILVREQDQTP